MGEFPTSTLGFKSLELFEVFFKLSAIVHQHLGKTVSLFSHHLVSKCEYRKPSIPCICSLCFTRRFYSHSPTKVGDSLKKLQQRRLAVFFRYVLPKIIRGECWNRWVGGPESNRKSIARPCRQPRRCGKRFADVFCMGSWSSTWFFSKGYKVILESFFFNLGEVNSESCVLGFLLGCTWRKSVGQTEKSLPRIMYRWWNRNPANEINGCSGTSQNNISSFWGHVSHEKKTWLFAVYRDYNKPL